MSTDFQKSAYIPKRASVPKKTTYALMNEWWDHRDKPSLKRSNTFHEMPTYSRHNQEMASPSSSRGQKPRKRFVGERFMAKRELLHETGPIDMGVHAPGMVYPTAQQSFGMPAQSRRLKNKPSIDPFELTHPVMTRYESEQLSPRVIEMEPQVHQSLPVHLGYNQSNGYDDFHKTFLNTPTTGIAKGFPYFGPPRLRHGRSGGSWRHVRDVLQAGGARTIFIEGSQRVADNDVIAGGRVPGANSIQHLYGDRNRFRKMTSYDLDALKGMEKGNWSIMR